MKSILIRCAVEECDKPKVRSSKYCSGHRHRKQRYGDPLGKPSPKEKKPKELCIISGCKRYRVSKQMCQAHYRRFKIHGDPLSHIPIIDGTGFIKSHRYRKITDRNHPLADNEGRVYEHRHKLYGYIGDGTHTCNWCDKEIRWLKEYSKNTYHFYLTVDHLDFDRHNNNLDNLVPACFECNSKRWRWNTEEVMLNG